MIAMRYAFFMKSLLSEITPCSADAALYSTPQ
jgi:hypothetical protein